MSHQHSRFGTWQISQRRVSATSLPVAVVDDGRVRYDWNRYGKPRTALVNRIGMWWLTVVGLVACPLFLLEAVTKDWTLAFPGLLLGGCAAVQRIAVRKVYGVREPMPTPAERQQTFAESVAEAVEAQRQRQWDAIAERAYLAMGGRPPAETGMGSVRDLELGFARLGATLGPCAHPNAEPVDLVTGERVAWVCPACPAELPADWR